MLYYAPIFIENVCGYVHHVGDKRYVSYPFYYSIRLQRIFSSWESFVIPSESWGGEWSKGGGG